mgnify:CR=1 FL=1
MKEISMEEYNKIYGDRKISNRIPRKGKIEYIYKIIKGVENGEKTFKDAQNLSGIRQNYFYAMFDDIIFMGFIKKIEKKNKVDKYIITKKGRDFIIEYDKMCSIIEKLNIMMK